MLFADLVIETLPGMAPAVGERMGRMKATSGISAEGAHRIRARWALRDLDHFEGLSEVLQAMNPEIIDVQKALGEDDS